MLQKIIDLLKCLTFHGEEAHEHVDFYAKEIYALKYQIAREVWDSYTGYETLFGDWLDQQEGR